MILTTLNHTIHRLLIFYLFLRESHTHNYKTPQVLMPDRPVILKHMYLLITVPSALSVRRCIKNTNQGLNGGY
jgi:hypothetical protein